MYLASDKISRNIKTEDQKKPTSEIKQQIIDSYKKELQNINLLYNPNKKENIKDEDLNQLLNTIIKDEDKVGHILALLESIYNTLKTVLVIWIKKGHKIENTSGATGTSSIDPELIAQQLWSSPTKKLDSSQLVVPPFGYTASLSSRTVDGKTTDEIKVTDQRNKRKIERTFTTIEEANAFINALKKPDQRSSAASATPAPAPAASAKPAPAPAAARTSPAAKPPAAARTPPAAAAKPASAPASTIIKSQKYYVYVGDRRIEI
jgi:hypothetical protein